MMFMVRMRIAAVSVFFLIAANALPAAEVTRRMGIFIGSNNGGRDRVLLRYAVSDAKSMSRIFGSMGGIAENDNILLVEPSVREINRQIDSAARAAAQSRRNSQRTELVFYYSGHSDENGILLNRERYGYAELRARINAVDADMKIVILDSCASGAMTRAKGGVKTQPFLFDSSVSATGYAILTSSSADEVSQESDSIESSYFTHSLMTGLRGAADSVGDGRVTLNELYRFAYAETMMKTETSMHGTQHPSYDIQISGSGDVVLTDIKEISAGLVIAEDVIGRISIRDSSDFLVAEVTKTARKPMELGLEPGLYRIVFQQGDNFYRAEKTLSESRRTNLGMGDFTVIATAPDGRSRGDNTPSDPASPDTDYPLRPLSLQVLPGIDIMGIGREKSTNNFLVGLIVGAGHNLDGLGAGTIGLINTGNIRGVQASGLFNYTRGNVDGIQAAGFINHTGGDVHWLQGAGIANIAKGEVQGIQGAGFVNYSGGNVQWLQGAGVVNIAKGDVQGIQVSGFVNIARGTVNGLQASVANYAGGLQGLQAGIINKIQQDREDTQGVQVGIVNISRSENVVPIGLINIVKNGIYHPSVYIDDMLFSNIGFRSGSKNFYVLMSMGVGGDNYNGNPVYVGAENRYYVSRAGIGVEIPINKAFIDIDASMGSIYKMNDDWSANSDNNNGNNSTLAFQLRLVGGYKFFKHFGIYGGVSYDYFYKWQDGSPDPRDFNGLMIGSVTGPNINKFGFLGGIQF